MGRKISITLNDLHEMIDMACKRIISEAISDREFHYLMLNRLCDMIESNSLHLSSAEEDNLNGKKFMSLTRNRSNQQGFQYGVYDQTEYESKKNYARIEFDGRTLQNIRGSKIEPYDYLYHEPTYDEHDPMNGKQLHQSEYDNDDWAEYDDNDPFNLKRQFYSQAEDRLTADEETIPNALKYVTKVDVMIRNKDSNDVERLMQDLEDNPMWKEKTEIHADNKTFNKPNGL
jgi:hypothetical protein